MVGTKYINAYLENDWLYLTFIPLYVAINMINVWELKYYCVNIGLFMTFLSPAAPKARDGRYCNAPRLSVTFSFRTVTQKRIDVFSQNFAGTCTMSWGCAV